MTGISLLIADDHQVVRLGLKNLLDGTSISVVAEATSGDEVLGKVASHKPDAVLLDVRMPGGDGLHILGRLKLDYPGGVTSLVVLALLNAGLPPDHPKVAAGLNYVRQRIADKTYSVALQSMAFCAANPSKYAAEIQRSTEWLVKSQSADGSWTYGERGGSNGDPSNTQFALLALYEAQRAGAKLSRDDWNAVYSRSKDYWLKIRNKDGSFPYNAGGNDVRGSMTCAGIASLVVGGVFVGLTAMKTSDTDDLCPDKRCTTPAGRASLDEANTFANVANGTLIAGALLLATGVVVFLTAPSDDPDSASIELLPGPASLLVRGRF